MLWKRASQQQLTRIRTNYLEGSLQYFPPEKGLSASAPETPTGEGVRITFTAHFDRVRIPIQIDNLCRRSGFERECADAGHSRNQGGDGSSVYSLPAWQAYGSGLTSPEYWSLRPRAFAVARLTIVIAFLYWSGLIRVRACK